MKKNDSDMNPEIDYENITEETLEEWVEFVNWLRVPPYLLTEELREKYKGLKSLESFFRIEKRFSDLKPVETYDPDVISFEKIVEVAGKKYYYYAFTIHNLELMVIAEIAKDILNAGHYQNEEITIAMKNVLERFEIKIEGVDKLIVKILHFALVR